jgi:hypothetical protein
VIAQQDPGLPPSDHSFTISAAGPADLPDVHALIAGLADYEGLTGICVATQDDLARALFGERRCAEALIARLDANSPVAAGFALFFHTYSTFLGRRTLWLEDLRPSRVPPQRIGPPAAEGAGRAGRRTGLRPVRGVLD